MKAHIVTGINSRTRGLAPLVIEHLSDENSTHRTSGVESVESEDGELYRLEIRNSKKVFAKSRHEPSRGKGGGKGKIDRECFRCGRIGHITADCRAKTHINGGPLKSAPKGKGVGRCEEQRLRRMCRWGPSIWGALRYCQITAMRWMMMVSLVKQQKRCRRRHLIPGSRGQRRCAGCFRNLAMRTTETTTNSIHSLIVGMGSKSSSMHCNKWTLGHETHRSLYPM